VMHRKPLSPTPLPARETQQAPDCALCSPHPKPPGSAGILPAAAGTSQRERKAETPERRLSNACRLEGGAPGHGPLQPSRWEGVANG